MYLISWWCILPNLTLTNILDIILDFVFNRTLKILKTKLKIDEFIRYVERPISVQKPCTSNQLKYKMAFEGTIIKVVEV